MWKRFLLIFFVLLLTAGTVAGIKFLQIRTMMAAPPPAFPPETVTTAVVAAARWEQSLTAVGSCVPVQGVTVAAERPGRVSRIAFEAGSGVAAGELLVELASETEEAELRAAEADLALAESDFQRMVSLNSRGIVAQADYDAAKSRRQQLAARVASLGALLGKKEVRAPFAGRLGIRQVNLGQIMKEGDPIVSLQRLDPIYVNFTLPQQDLAHLATGMAVEIGADTLAAPAAGSLTTIDPELDPATRAVLVQATVPNPGELLRPGMFVTVRVLLPEATEVLTVPATAVLYAPYSDSVFVVEEKKNEQTGESGLALRQQFVELGERRGDFVAVAKGLKEGEEVASTGVFKLRNGQAVTVDNALAPEFSLTPSPENK